MIEPYWNDAHDEYAVLISYGFGAGWSTWRDRALAYDARVVKFWLDHVGNEEWMSTVNESGLLSRPESAAHKEAREFFESIGYENCPYMGGFPDIDIQWVPAGAKWRIREYDGAESIEIEENVDWTCFY